MAHPITSTEVKAAIRGQQAPINLEDLDDILGGIQEDTEDHWHEHMSTVEEGELELVSQSEETLVFADLTGRFWRAKLDLVAKYINLLGVEDEGTPESVIAAHHNAAYRLVEYNWATANPVVATKPADFDSAQVFVEATINSLIARGLSPGQSWAYYGVIIRGFSRNEWAQRCGYADHSAVSAAVRKAKEKLGT